MAGMDWPMSVALKGISSRFDWTGGDNFGHCILWVPRPKSTPIERDQRDPELGCRVRRLGSQRECVSMKPALFTAFQPRATMEVRICWPSHALHDAIGTFAQPRQQRLLALRVICCSAAVLLPHAV